MVNPSARFHDRNDSFDTAVMRYHGATSHSAPNTIVAVAVLLQRAVDRW